MYIDTKDNDSSGRIVLNAEKADKLTVSAGSTSQPVYFKDGVPTKIDYTIKKSVPSNAVFTDTHNVSSNIVNKTASSTADTTSALTNGNVYLNHIDGGAVTSSHKISGSGATSVTTDADGNIIISSTNSTYGAAGSGLGLVKSGGDVTITNGVINVNDNSHGHIIENIEGLQDELDSKADASQGIYYIEGTGSTAGTWLGNHNGITEYYNGLVLAYKIPIAGDSDGTTLNINNLGAITVRKNNNSAISTSFPVNSVIFLVYTTDGGTAYWKAHDYDSNTRYTVGDYQQNGVKLYLVGSKSTDTATSTSYANSYTNANIYVGTDNKLYATKGFAGTADRAISDGAGNNIVNTYETKTNSASNLDAAKQYADTVSGKVKTDLLGDADANHNTLGKLSALITANDQAIDVLDTEKVDNTIKVSAGTGLTGGGTLAANRTISANLVSTTKLTNAATAATETAGRVYPVAVDKNGKLAVNVPWVNDNTTYGIATSSTAGLVKSGGDITVATDGTVSVNDNSHGHIIGNIEGLQSALNAKSNTGHTHWINEIKASSTAWPDQTLSGTNVEELLMSAEERIIALESNKAPNNHASTSKTYGVGDGTNYGHVKLSSATNETATITDGIAATPAAVKAVNDKAITGLSVSGKVITYTKGDGTTGTITTQDTNTDTKVTQTEKSDNVNYPILGVPTASPTSGTAYTAIYDKGMHINPSTNTITATTFAGTASKALADGLGNNIVNTYETKTDAAAKLTEAKEDAAAKLTEAKKYTDAAKTALLGGASEAHNTLDKLGDLIVANAQAIEVANTNINNKANSAVTITAGNGLTGGGNLTTNRTIAVGAGTGITVAADSVSAKVRSTTKLTSDSVAATETSGRVYPVAVDKSGYLAVNVPWANDNTTYSAGTGISINGTTINHFNSITAGSTIADAQTPAHGESFNIPKIDYDAQGHITGVSTATVTLPADKNTDTKVTQTVRTTNGEFPVLLRGTSAGTTTTTTTTTFGTKVTVNPSTGAITAAGGFKGTADNAVNDGLGNTITSTYETKEDAAAKLTEAKTYADTAATTVKNDLLNGAGAAYDTLKELADEIIGNDQAIEVLTSTAANKADKSITITAGNGLTGGGTLEANRTIAVGAGTGITVAANSVSAALVSTTKLTNAATAATETSGRVYPVAVDKNGKLAVNVPWSNTTYSAGTGISIDSSNKINHFNSVTAGTIGAAQTATHGGNIAIPSITYDAQGHITGATTVNVTLPKDNNTDTKVKQGRSTTSSWRPILSHLTYGAYGEDPSPDGATGQVYYHESMAIQPSTGTIKATTFDGNALKDGLGQNIVNTYATKTNAISSITGDGSSTTINYTKADGTTGSFTTKNTTYSAATSSKAGLMSAADKAKLDGIATGANNYTLPTASSTVLGGVKIGSNVNISSGVISVPAASGTVAGVTVVYPAAKCTTFTSDSGTVTPAAVKKAVDTFAITKAAGGTFSNDGATQGEQPSLTWKTWGENTPYIGYATDQSDGTFILASLKGTDYATGLAIGGGSGNLLWKGNKVAVVGDIPAVGNGTITIKQAGVSKGTFTTNQNGNTTIELTDSNTTYSNASTTTAGLMSAADKAKLDGIATGANNFTYSLPLASSSTRGGVKIGFTTSATNRNYAVQLSSEKMYVNVPWTDTTYSAATTTTAGLMSAADKTKLDGIATGANKITIDSAMSSTSTNPVQNKVVNAALGTKLPLSGGTITGTSGDTPLYIQSAHATGSFIGFRSSDGTLQGYLGVNSGAPVFYDNGNKTIYHSGNLVAATTTAAGLMSAADKTKLDGIAAGANKYSLPLASSSTRGGVKIGYTQSGKNYPVQLSSEKMYVNVPWTDTTYTFTNKNVTLAWGTKSTIATVGGTDITVTMPANPNTNTHYKAYLYATGSTGTAHASTTNGNTYLRLIENSEARSSIKVAGAGLTTVKSDGSGNITISTLNGTNAGDANTPIYLNGGTFTACTSLDLNTTGSAAKLAGGTTLTSSTVDGFLEKHIVKWAPADATAVGNNDGIIMSFGWSDAYGAQLWLDDGSGEGGMKLRNRTSNSWNPWRQIISELGGTLTGALHFANGTWNNIGDDCALGDYNQAGVIGIKGLNGATGIYFVPYSGSTAQKITIDGAGTMSITGKVSTETLQTVSNGVTSTIGSQNNGWLHYNTNSPSGHWFNKNVSVQGNIYAGTNYSDLVLTSANYTSYAPTKTGSGASGTWGINITGNAATSNTATTSNTSGYLNINNTANLSSGLQYVQASAQTSGNDLPTNTWWHVIKMNHGQGDTYYKRLLAFDFWNDNIYTSGAAGDGAVRSWKQVWVQGNSVTGAVWNDYAECRESDCEDFGYVLMEVGDDSLTKTTERLSHFAGVSSDTWGFSQGETNKAKTPIAVAGRVLVYTYQDRNNYKPGDCVCAAPGGTVDIMTREEIREYPDRIVGTVSCIPDYEEWGGGEIADRKPVKVNNRIWIKVV